MDEELQKSVDKYNELMQWITSESCVRGAHKLCVAMFNGIVLSEKLDTLNKNLEKLTTENLEARIKAILYDNPKLTSRMKKALEKQDEKIQGDY